MRINQIRILTLVVLIMISLTLLTLLPVHANNYRNLSSEPQRLTVEIKPQPANGYNGRLLLSFNQPIANQVEILIHNDQGRLQYKATYAAGMLNSLYFGQHLPTLSAGSYYLTVVSDNLVIRKALSIY
jgi:hypothetical protein